MLFWSYPLRLNLAFFWLLVLVAIPKAAIADEYQDAIADPATAHAQPSPKTKLKPKPTNIFSSFSTRDRSTIDNEIVASSLAAPPNYALAPGQTIEKIENAELEQSSADIEESKKPEEEPEEKPENLDPSGYAVPPHTVPLASLPPSGTQFRLNRQWLNHLSKTELQTGYQFGHDVNSTSSVQGTIALDSRLQRSITNDQVVTVEHKGTYLQTESVARSREVTLTQTLPETVNGVGIQLSFTGACLFPETTSEERCSYTPGLSTVQPNDIFELQEAGKLQDDGKLGEILTDESLAAIAQPGFQRGVDGQAIGVDLLFPNVGTRAGNRLSDKTSIDRTETYDIVPSFTLARSRQIVRMNEKEAALGLTIRGNTWISQDANIEINALLQAGVALLPDIVPRLKGSDKTANPRVNSNLFLAANNARLPPGGFTLYQGGISRADSIEPDMQPQDLPSAKFKGVWIGLSPVVDYHIGIKTSSKSLDALRLIQTIGAEGKSGGSSNLFFLAAIDGDEFIAANIQDTYIQIYQSLYETDSQTVTVENYKEQTSYYPHIRVTGNTTDFDSVFNYYAGLIVEDRLNAYAGADYTIFSPNGLTYELGSVFYTQPDRDYYSQLSGKITKRVRLSEQASLSLSSGLNWALDRKDQIGDVELNSRSSAVYLQARADLDPVFFQAIGNLGGILPDSARSELRLQSGVKLLDKVTLSGFITAFSKSSSYARYGTSLAWQPANEQSPVLSIGWTNNRYGFGTDQLGNDISTSEDIFAISLNL